LNDPSAVEATNTELGEILEEVKRIELVSSRLVTDVMSGGYSSVFRGSGVEFSEVREYVDGDDPRSVDWNVTARLGRPFVKKFVDERELSVLFLVDLSSSMNAGFGPWSARQVAARLCACLGLSAVRNNDKVGLLTFSDRVENYAAPAKGMGHALRLVRDILVQSPSSNVTNMAPALDFAARVPRRHAVVFLISDFFGFEWESELKLCALRHDVVAIRLLAPELSGLDSGLMRMTDPESGETRLVDWGDATLRERYRQKTEAWKEETAATLRRLQVDLVDVEIPRTNKPEAISRPLLRFFQMREARGAKR
jgi:uncharacterized protein (DUF58 family)